MPYNRTYLLDVLALVAEEARAKLEEEEKRKRKKIKNSVHQLQPFTVPKRKRSDRVIRKIRMPITTNYFDDHQESLYLIEEKEEENEEEEATPEKEKKKIKKAADNDDDHGLIKKKKKNYEERMKVFFPPPDMPIEFKNRVSRKAESNGGVVGDMILVIQKPLTSTDLKKGHNRFSIPLKQILGEFLEPGEVAALKEHDGKHCATKKVNIIEPSGKIEELKLSRWEMRKEAGKSPSVSYVLNGGWKNVVSYNKLRKDDVVQLWAVRIREELCFVLVVLSNSTGDGDGSSSINSSGDLDLAC